MSVEYLRTSYSEYLPSIQHSQRKHYYLKILHEFESCIIFVVLVLFGDGQAVYQSTFITRYSILFAHILVVYYYFWY